MCCNYRKPVVEALNLFRDQTGLRIGQKEWHLLRTAAEARMHADGTLAADKHLTNARADAQAVIQVASQFAASLKTDSVTSAEFIARLGHMGMSQGNVATLTEVTRKVTAGEPVGGVARQPKNGKNVTKTDLIDRAGGFTTPANNTAIPTRVQQSTNESWDTTPAHVNLVPTTPGQTMMRTLENLLKETHAHHGIVTSTGLTFEIGERAHKGYAFVIKAESATSSEPVTLTVGQWNTERTCNIIRRKENLSLVEVEKYIRASFNASQISAAA